MTNDGRVLMRLPTKLLLYEYRHGTNRGGFAENDADIDAFGGRGGGPRRHYSALNCYGKSGGDAGNQWRWEAGHYCCLKVGLRYGCC